MNFAIALSPVIITVCHILEYLCVTCIYTIRQTIVLQLCKVKQLNVKHTRLLNKIVFQAIFTRRVFMLFLIVEMPQFMYSGRRLKLHQNGLIYLRSHVTPLSKCFVDSLMVEVLYMRLNDMNNSNCCGCYWISIDVDSQFSKCFRFSMIFVFKNHIDTTDLGLFQSTSVLKTSAFCSQPFLSI